MKLLRSSSFFDGFGATPDSYYGKGKHFIEESNSGVQKECETRPFIAIVTTGKVEKWTEVNPGLQVGDVALLKKDNAAPASNPYARILRLFSDAEGMVGQFRS